MLVHAACPAGQQVECDLAAALWSAFWSGFACKPEVSSDQWQNRAGCRAGDIQLGLNKAFAAVSFAPLHETLPALNTLTVAPFVGDM